MNQTQLLVVSREREKALIERLKTADFEVKPSGRMPGGIYVRVRADTKDQSEVERIVSEVAPDATYGISAAPTQHVVNYRDGR